jgi:hypothetical protein
VKSLGQKRDKCELCGGNIPVRKDKKTGLCNRCSVRMRRCEACGRMIGLRGVHQCASVDQKGDRFCIECGKLLKNEGWERWSKSCLACNRKKQRSLEKEERARIKQAFGNRCSVCGYDRCKAALHFHHKEGKKGLWKEIRKGSVSLRELRARPERFVLLCANCHIELEEEVRRNESLRR